MSGDIIMDWAGYWDEGEFEFFNTLEDEDKLMYIYDLCLGEVSYMDIHSEGVEQDKQESEINQSMEDALRAMGESLDDVEPEQTFRNEINVVINNEVLKISGPTLDVILKVASDMQMNGIMLLNRKIDFTKYDPWHVVLTYDIVGQGSPISLN